jgi:hypothetical protein
MTLIHKLAPLSLLALMVVACGGPQPGSSRTTTTPPGPAAEPTMVRFVHAMPDGSTVGAWVGDTEIASNLAYTQFGQWREVASGERDVALRRGEAVELSEAFHFEPHRRYWIFAWGSIHPRGHETAADLLIVPEEPFASDVEEAWVRFANLATAGEAYGLAVTTGGSWQGLFPNQRVGTVSEFKLGPVYDTTFEIFPARDTSLPSVASYTVDVQVGLLYTVVVAGRAQGGNLEVFHIAETARR